MAKPPEATLTQVERDKLAFLKRRFDASHADAAAAMERGDLRAAARAIRVQREILEEQQALIVFRLLSAKSM